MPSITIRERDLTSAGNLEATTNAVYIPGYANMGPTDIPTMCETLSDFQLIFGSEPYTFRQPQAWPGKFSSSAAVSAMGKFYEKGEFEKSYIMAAELLKLGIPVLYERIGSEALKSNWSAFAKVAIVTATGAYDDGLTVKAISPGYASSKIKFTINKYPCNLGKDASGNRLQSVYFVISVWRDADVEYAISKISPQQTQFTFDPKVTALYPNYVTIVPGKKFVDASGLVELSFNDEPSMYEADSTSIEGYIDQSTSELKIFSLEFDPTKLQNIYSNTANRTGLLDEFKVEEMYNTLSTTGINKETGELLGLNKLLDKGEYIIKFITTGAYPTFEYDNNTLAQKVLEVAANRGDCTALIDHTPNNDRTLLALDTNSVYAKVIDWADTYTVNTLGEDAFTYGAMFTPYGVYNCISVNKQIMLPASFGYLAALAASVQTNGNWMAAAGVQRGSVPNLISLSQNLTNAIADSYQPRDGIAINPITNIKPYGLTIWGNRTLKNNAKAGDLTATSFLSIRQLTNDVKRTVWVAAKTLTFEQNSDLLWINFKSKIIPTLDQMVSGSGLSGYDINKQKTNKKATVKAVIRLYAIEPVEDWDITIELADSSTEIAG